jgi:S-methylmethionine-dependent homocysteine/selenocysteine methylase
MTQITLLDGSIGQELVKRTGDQATPLWSTSAMLDHPDLVGAVHKDYFDAGATIATTNTYAVHRSRLVGTGLEDQFESLLKTAVLQAKSARDAHGSGRIAGAMGPLLATYRPDLKPDVALAAKRFGEIAAVMAPDVDFYLIETVSSVLEAEGALQGVIDVDKPVWLALSVEDDDGRVLRSGEPLSEIAPLIEIYKPDAVLVNCSRPEAMPEALKVVAEFGPPYGAYANGFTGISDAFLEDRPSVDVLEARGDLGPDAYADHAMRWVDMGATIVGGCCEVGPAHIAELARRLRADGHDIV